MFCLPLPPPPQSLGNQSTPEDETFACAKGATKYQFSM